MDYRNLFSLVGEGSYYDSSTTRLSSQDNDTPYFPIEQPFAISLSLCNFATLGNRDYRVEELKRVPYAGIFI